MTVFVRQNTYSWATVHTHGELAQAGLLPYFANQSKSLYPGFSKLSNKLAELCRQTGIS